MILKGTSHIHPTFWLLSGSFLYNKWSISTFEEKCQVEFFEGKGVCIYVKELAAKSAVLVMSQSLAGSQSFRSRILVGMPELPALHVSQDSAGWQNIPSSHWCRRQLSEQSQPSQELSILDNLFSLWGFILFSAKAGCWCFQNFWKEACLLNLFSEFDVGISNSEVNSAQPLPSGCSRSCEGRQTDELLSCIWRLQVEEWE